MTRHALALAAFLLLGVGVHAQGSNMEPIYAYDQSDWFNSTTTAFTISYEIRGYTYCPSGCPANVYHYGVITLQVGGDNESENFYGAKVPPQDNLDVIRYVGGPGDSTWPNGLPMPVTGAFLSSDGYVVCTQRGTISSDNYGILSQHLTSDTVFLQARANSAYADLACTYSGDTTPDWVEIPFNNPYGTQGSNPSPLYIEMERLSFAQTTPASNQSSYRAFPILSWTYVFSEWIHTGSGLPEPMPQQCTQNIQTYSVFNPGWISPPQ